jgi:alkylated DNA repair dioxygenase AlkB
MSSHADNEPELGKDPLIAALSLGVPRRFLLRHKNKKFKGGKKSMVLHHGSLFIMGGDLQHRWRHSVPQTGGPTGTRINITFRWLHGSPGWIGDSTKTM